MKLTITAIATGLALLLTQPAIAGGAVLEDTTETVAPDRDRKIGGFLIALAAVALIASLANSNGNCVTEEVTPGPTPDPVGC